MAGRWKKRLSKAVGNPGEILKYLVSAHYDWFSWMSDECFLRIKYEVCMGKKLRLDAPQTFNEKLQWLKLFDRRPEYTMMVDKYKVREYIAEKLGEEYLIPLLGVWENPDEIDFDALPERFVLKCNHNSGLGMCICKDKTKLNIGKVKDELRKGLCQDYYLSGREWPYKDVPRRVIAEKYMSDEEGEELLDYKLMCFGGKVLCSFVCSERFSANGLKVTFYDRDWKKMSFTRHYPASEQEIHKPRQYAKMLEFSEKLSQDIPFVRTDFYEIRGRLYFGELTFYPGSGMEEFVPESWDYKLGEWINLSEDLSHRKG